VCYEYIGYGHTYDAESEGSIYTLQPSEDGCYESVDAAFDYVSNVLNVPTHKQIWMGHSIGSGPTVDLAARMGDNINCGGCIAGVILVSPFTSATDVAYPLLSFVYNMFPNLNKVHRIRSEVLLLHGMRDDLISWQHSKSLAETRKLKSKQETQLTLIRNAHHNNVFEQEETWEAIESFIKSLSLIDV